MLSEFFGNDAHLVVTSDVLPGTVRQFNSYQAVATEAGLSRIFAGVHTRLDHESGLKLGRDVAQLVLRDSKKGDFGVGARSGDSGASARTTGGY